MTKAEIERTAVEQNENVRRQKWAGHEKDRK